MPLFEVTLTVKVLNSNMLAGVPNGNGINLSFCEVSGVDLALNGGYAIARKYIGQARGVNGQAITTPFKSGMCLAMINGLDISHTFGRHSGLAALDFRGAIVLHSAPNINIPLPSASFPLSSHGNWVARSILGNYSLEIYADDNYSIRIDISTANQNERYTVAGFFGHKSDDLRLISDALIRNMYQHSSVTFHAQNVPMNNLLKGHVNPYYAAAAYIAMMQSYDDYGVNVTARTLDPTATTTGTINTIANASPISDFGEYFQAKKDDAPQLDQIAINNEEELDELSVLRISGDASFQYTFTDGSETITVRLPDSFVYIGEVGGIVVVARNGALALLLSVADYKKDLDKHTLRVLEDQSRRLRSLSQAYRLLLPGSAENNT